MLLVKSSCLYFWMSKTYVRKYQGPKPSHQEPKPSHQGPKLIGGQAVRCRTYVDCCASKAEAEPP